MGEGALEKKKSPANPGKVSRQKFRKTPRNTEGGRQDGMAVASHFYRAPKNEKRRKGLRRGKRGSCLNQSVASLAKKGEKGPGGNTSKLKNGGRKRTKEKPFCFE